MDPLEELALLVKAAQRAGDQRVNEALRPLGITAAQAEVLIVLAQVSPLSLGELGGLLVSEGGHPSRLVDRLVRAGLVERQTAEADQRRLELRLTPRGQQLAQAALAHKQALLAAFNDKMAQYDLGQVRAVLEAYLEGSTWAQTVQLRRDLHDTAKKS